MPRLSDSMEEGTVLRWMKSVGDEVALGEELVEIETDKANMVFESDAAGTLVEIVADEGATLPIGEVIARVGDARRFPAAAPRSSDGDEARRTVPTPLRIARRTLPTPTPPPSTASGCPSPAATPRARPPLPRPSAGDDGRVKASPIARRIAEEKGVDLASLAGSGPGGRIIKADVEKAAGGRAGAEARRARARRRRPGRRRARPRPRRARSRSSS